MYRRKNELCNYLIKIVREYGADLFAWGKTIWDLGAAGILYKKEWSQWEIRSVPMITEQLTFSFGLDRPLIACVRSWTGMKFPGCISEIWKVK